MSQTKCTVSVVTPSFNQGRFLKECLESVANQREESDNIVEHIVRDNLSTDETMSVLRAHPEVRCTAEKDRGQSHAFNLGVSEASGEWICWLNADDCLAPGALKQFRNTLHRTPNADVIYGHVQFIDEHSQPVRTCYHLPYFYFLTLYGCYIPPSSGTFFRRKLLLDNPVDENFHYVMDVEWYLRCGSRINTQLINNVLSHFRISSTAKTSEMIRSGKITERHAQERTMYKRMHVYPRWPRLTEAQAEARLARRHRIAQLVYYALKLRYLGNYIVQARTNRQNY